MENNSFIKKSRRLSALLVMVLLPVLLSAKIAYRGFAGGMYYHAGYVQGSSFDVLSSGAHRVQGLTTGIGGRGAFILAPHWRVGPEGYSTTTDNYDGMGSYYKVGWGGVLNEYFTTVGKCRLFAGATLGGGTIRHLIMLDEQDNSFEPRDCVLRKYPAFIVNPTIGVDIPMNPRLFLSFKIDYMVNLSSSKEPDYASGPRLYIGIIFGRDKKKIEQ